MRDLGRGHRRPGGWVLPAGWAGSSVLFFLCLLTGALGRRGTVIVDDYGSALAPLIAGVACCFAARRARGRQRRGWCLLAAALICWAAGGVAWTVYEVYLGRDVPFPSLADVGYLLFVPFAVAALLPLGGRDAGGAGRLRPLFDGGIAAAALLFISWATVLGPALRSAEGPLLTRAITLAYPSGDVLTATIALLAVARAKGRQRTTMTLIGAGLLTVAVADSAFTWFTAQGAYETGNLFDTGYVAGYLLIGLAACLDRPDDAPADDRTDPAPGRLALFLPYAPLAVSVPFAVALQLRGQPLGPFLFYDSLAVVVLVLARQLINLQTNAALTRELHDTVATLRHREAELHHQAFHDPLTGLANRALFADRVGHALARVRRPSPVAVLLADLDDFKTVNDSLGHPAGDALLVAVAERLRGSIRPGDTVARLGGDEFAVLLDDGAEDALHEASEVAERIGQALEHPFTVSGSELKVRASIGVTVTDGTKSRENLLREADIAMYSAKARGKGRYIVYAPALAADTVDRVRLKKDLGSALARNQLSLQYQPIVDVTTGRVTAVEALLRWTHPEHGRIEPDRFIPLAEQSGDIRPIGRWVLASACADAGRWQAERPAGTPALGLSVNLSGRQLGDPELIPAVVAALAAAELPAALLTLEITESVLIEDEPATLRQLRGLRALGVRLALDDFGTGYSALSSLRRFPIDALKIDRSFIAALTAAPGPPEVLLKSILDLGRGLGLQLVAEGVETDDQLRVVRTLGCPQAQGFLFARPAEAGVISELVRAGITLTDPADAAVADAG